MLKLTLLLAAVSASFALNRSVIATPNAPGAIGPYAQGQLLTLASGERMIHAAGQIGLDPSTGALAPGGITGEAPQAMNNVQAIIESVPGASMADVYECTVLMANLTEYAGDPFSHITSRWVRRLSRCSNANCQPLTLTPHQQPMLQPLTLTPHNSRCSNTKHHATPTATCLHVAADMAARLTVR